MEGGGGSEPDPSCVTSNKKRHTDPSLTVWALLLLGLSGGKAIGDGGTVSVPV